jgi:hypothetical protein
MPTEKGTDMTKLKAFFFLQFANVSKNVFEVSQLHLATG